MNRGHWLNLAIQIAILIVMLGIAAISIDIYVGLVAVLLLVLPAVNWTVAGVLLWTSRQDTTVRSLSDAADNALTWAVNSTVAAIVAGMVLARSLGLLSSPIGSVTGVLLGFIVVTGSLPALRFLRTWRDVWLPMVRRRDEQGG